MKSFSILFLLVLSLSCSCQINQDQMGLWKMYFVKADFKESQFGFQGDFQIRNWDLTTDLEQTIIRGGLTFKPKNESVLFTLGYGNILYGAFGYSRKRLNENRIYQEVLYPVKFGKRIYTKHRFRFEQKCTEIIGFRTRLRYKFFVSIPINQAELNKGAIYFTVYNELFINGMTHLKSGFELEHFDRNRFYTSLGYILNDSFKIQIGIMNQSTNNWRKSQLQISCHHWIVDL